MHTKILCILFTFTFFLTGHINKQNCGYWTDGNAQYPEKVNVWDDILDNYVIGS